MASADPKPPGLRLDVRDARVLTVDTRIHVGKHNFDSIPSPSVSPPPAANFDSVPAHADQPSSSSSSVSHLSSSSSSPSSPLSHNQPLNTSPSGQTKRRRPSPLSSSAPSPRVTADLQHDGDHASEEDDGQHSPPSSAGPTSSVSRENHCIFLPHQREPSKFPIAIDIGGSLIKLVYFEPEESYQQRIIAQSQQDNRPSKLAKIESEPSASDLPSTSPAPLPSAEQPSSAVLQPSQATTVPMKNATLGGGRLCFVKFETSSIEECISFIEGLVSAQEAESAINATGGGAHKFHALFKSRLGITLDKKDEIKCLITGLDFLLRRIPNESFVYEGGHGCGASGGGPSSIQKGHRRFVTDKELDYPYLLVQIGSGVSVIRVDGGGKFERISGSSIGGGTFWGLCRLLTNSQSFDQALYQSENGDNRGADMLVGDIYGCDYSSVGLASDTIASSVGKAVSKQPPSSGGPLIESFAPEDISKSLLLMVSNNIGQIAYLNAMRHGIKRIYFGGFFIRDHEYTMQCISEAVEFWSKGSMQALFLKHEGYLGALGAFLDDHDEAVGSAASSS